MKNVQFFSLKILGFHSQTADVILFAFGFLNSRDMQGNKMG